MDLFWEAPGHFGDFLAFVAVARWIAHELVVDMTTETLAILRHSLGTRLVLTSLT